MICAVFILVMFVSPIQPSTRSQSSDMSLLLDELAQISTRPRYAFMLLSLIADIARSNGSAGPHVLDGDASVPLRDWLCDALTPMGRRDPKRLALTQKVRDEFERRGTLPADPHLAAGAIEEEVRERVRASGKTNLSRAVTELVKAGLLKRHYQGYCVDHLNRGAQRHAVYTLVGRARCLLARRASTPAHPVRQGELPL